MRRAAVAGKSQQSKALKVVKELDAFPKVPDNFKETTASGGGISIATFVVIIILVISEISYYTDTSLKFDYVVDTEVDGKVKINIDMTVAMRCDLIGADVLDQTGQDATSHGALEMDNTHYELSPKQKHYRDITQHINMYLRDEYHAIQELMWLSGTHPSVKAGMPQREDNPEMPVDACRVHGTLEVNKVAGNFHITAGKSVPVIPRGHAHLAIMLNPKGIIPSYSLGLVMPIWRAFSLIVFCSILSSDISLETSFKDVSNDISHDSIGQELNEIFQTVEYESYPHPKGHIHITGMVEPEDYNFTHRIDHFSFGEKTGGVINPLDGEEQVTKQNYQIFQYFMKIVPTDVRTYTNQINTYQYSVTERNRTINHSSGSHGVPGIFVKYDTFPFKIRIKEEHKPYSQFLIRLCGIVGGIFVVSGLLHNSVGFLVDVLCCRFKLGRYGKNSQSEELLYPGSETLSSNQSPFSQESQNSFNPVDLIQDGSFPQTIGLASSNGGTISQNSVDSNR